MSSLVNSLQALLRENKALREENDRLRQELKDARDDYAYISLKPDPWYSTLDATIVSSNVAQSD